MKLKTLLPIVLLLPMVSTYADTPVATDSQQTCENRINALKSALQTAIDKKQNVDAAKEQLDQINKLPSALSPCEKQKLIPVLSNKNAEQQTNEDLKDRKISP